MLRLRKERLARGWSLTDVCTRTGIDPAALSKIEREIWPCGPGWRKKLCEAFGMEEHELFKRVA